MLEAAQPGVFQAGGILRVWTLCFPDACLDDVFLNSIIVLKVSAIVGVLTGFRCGSFQS